MKPYIIAEIGCNHMGNLEIAKEMIKMAAVFCQADAVKFQKRNNKELLSLEQYNAPHPVPYNSYGKTYGEHREYLEFTVEQHRELKNYCEEWNIEYSCSVWDLTSAMEIASIEPKFIKIPSAQNNNYKMLEWLVQNYKGDLQISVGMTSRAEAKELVDFLVKHNRAKDTILYSCTSGYPVPDEDVCLLEIRYLKETFGDLVKAIGFSGHHNGISLDIAALTLGAEYFERHFTLDRTWKGTDHAASLESDGLRRLVRNLHSANKALCYKKEDILDIEKVQREKLKYRSDK